MYARGKGDGEKRDGGGEGEGGTGRAHTRSRGQERSDVAGVMVAVEERCNVHARSAASCAELVRLLCCVVWYGAVAVCFTSRRYSPSLMR